MRCREFIRRLGDYVDGDLDPLQRAHCVLHLTQCADCAAYMQGYRLTIQAAHSSDGPEVTEGIQVDRLIDCINHSRRASSVTIIQMQ